MCHQKLNKKFDLLEKKVIAKKKSKNVDVAEEEIAVD